MFQLPTVRDVTGRTYIHVVVRHTQGEYENWFLTENEVERIRERSADKASLVPLVPAPEPLPAWKRLILRVIGVEAL